MIKNYVFPMAFKDPIAYLLIKIWIKFKLPKQPYNQRLGLVKLKNPRRPNCQKLKRDLKNEPKQPKTIGLISNLIIACSLCNIASICHISLFQLQIVIRLKHWILDFLSFKAIQTLHSLVSISHISLISTLNCEPFEVLDS